MPGLITPECSDVSTVAQDNHLSVQVGSAPASGVAVTPCCNRQSSTASTQEAYLADIIDRMAKGHPINRLSELLPWNWEKVEIKLAG